MYKWYKYPACYQIPDPLYKLHISVPQSFHYRFICFKMSWLTFGFIIEASEQPLQYSSCDSEHLCCGRCPCHNVPADRPIAEHQRKRTKHGPWPQCCSHISTTNHSIQKTQDKTGYDVSTDRTFKTKLQTYKIHKKSKNLNLVFLVHHMSFISNSHIYLLGPVMTLLKKHLSWFWHWILMSFFQNSMCHF